jgi:PTH2 family peptidyl-tRNA hydrolase
MNNVVEKVKQVIVMRTKYPDGQGGFRTVRKGKLIAQGAHAAMAWLTRRMYYDRKTKEHVAMLTEEEKTWTNEGFTKVVLYVQTEEELLALHKKCVENGLTAFLIKDKGDTEFGGVPTYTALGIGPHKESKINPITGDLPLL